jgi:hypothetical protein
MAEVQGDLGRAETGQASQAARRVSPGYCRVPPPSASTMTPAISPTGGLVKDRTINFASKGELWDGNQSCKREIPSPVRHYGGSPDIGCGGYHGQLWHEPNGHACGARRPD